MAMNATILESSVEDLSNGMATTVIGGAWQRMHAAAADYLDGVWRRMTTCGEMEH